MQFILKVINLIHRGGVWLVCLVKFMFIRTKDKFAFNAGDLFLVRLKGNLCTKCSADDGPMLC